MSSVMQTPSSAPSFDRPLVVGSVSRGEILETMNPDALRLDCDLLEIRLDGMLPHLKSSAFTGWQRFSNIPLLFTARRTEEGGLARCTTAQRISLLEAVLPFASLIDVEAACIGEMQEIIRAAGTRRVRWVASFHDFHGMPAEKALLSALQAAKDAGAAVFKWAAMVHTPADLARLAEFQLADHGIPVASMGMGKLAVVSRLLCAQCGSVLNYGYLGDEPTAPGQWDAGSLKRAISMLPAA